MSWLSLHFLVVQGHLAVRFMHQLNMQGSDRPNRSLRIFWCFNIILSLMYLVCASLAAVSVIMKLRAIPPLRKWREGMETFSIIWEPEPFKGGDTTPNARWFYGLTSSDLSRCAILDLANVIMVQLMFVLSDGVLVRIHSIYKRYELLTTNIEAVSMLFTARTSTDYTLCCAFACSWLHR